jgi:hypothetical protein
MTIEDQINEQDVIFSALEEGAVYNVIGSGGILLAGYAEIDLLYLSSGGLSIAGNIDSYLSSEDIAAGGVSSHGDSEVLATYNIEIAGGVYINPAATENALAENEVSGGIQGGGTIKENLEDIIETMGGIVLGGTARVSKNINLVVGGFADVSVVSQESPSGGLILNGFIFFTYNELSLNGILLSGESESYVDFEISGGLIASGESDNNKESIVGEIASGIHVSGNSHVEFIYEAVSESGLLTGGSSDSEILTFIDSFALLASGEAESNHLQEESSFIAAVVSGTSDVFVSYFADAESSGLLTSGLVELGFGITIEGGLLAAGSVIEIKISEEEVTGGLALGGVFFVQQDYSDIIGSGGVFARGQARSENLRPLFSNRSSFSRASGTPNIINTIPENLNKLIDFVGTESPELPEQSLRGLPPQSYCIFEENCVDGYPKIPTVILKRLGKYAPKKIKKPKKKDLEKTLSF